MLEEIADLPGRQLFVWKNEAGALSPVESGRLNNYLAEISGIAITAKTFRTWAGSLAAFSVARNAIENGERPTVKKMAEASAKVLHNTPAISRSSYIHPAIIALADKDHLRSQGDEMPPVRQPLHGLRAEENRLLNFLSHEAEPAETAVRKAS